MEFEFIKGALLGWRVVLEYIRYTHYPMIEYKDNTIRIRNGRLVIKDKSLSSHTLEYPLYTSINNALKEGVVEL